MAVNSVTFERGSGHSVDQDGSSSVDTATAVMQSRSTCLELDTTADPEKDDVTEYMYRPDLSPDVAHCDRMVKHSRLSKIEKAAFYFTTVFFWVLSLLTVALGVYVYHERTLPVPVILQMHVDPSSILIVCGLIAFMLTICGFIGALRENICLLKVFAFGLLSLVGIQTAFIVLIFLVLYTNINITVNPSSSLEKALVQYSDDDSMRDLMDFLQINFHCCGVGDSGYLEWNFNPYFNCSVTNPSVQRCGVPFSCCRIEEGMPINTLCGSDATNETITLFEVQHRIYTDGCVEAVVRMLYENAFLTGANVFGTTILMFVGVFSAVRMAARLQRNRDYNVLALQTTILTRL